MSAQSAASRPAESAPKLPVLSAACFHRSWPDLAALVCVLAACVPLLRPFLRPGMPATHDGFLHMQRLIALDAAAHQGELFGRWLPDLAYGYGQPLLLYYAPLSYAPALALHLIGFGYVASYELASALALILSALSMYVFGRSLFGPLGAGGAAVVYAALPYQLVDLYVRGALAETWAFVWLPLIGWALVKTQVAPSPWWLATAALAFAGLILTHNVTAMLAVPAFVVLVGFLQIGRGHADWRVAALALVALALGVGLAAWFWAPALAERHLVQIEQTIEPKLFASFFVSGWPPFRLDPIFNYEQPVSDALGYPIYWPQVGLVQALVSVAGVLAVLRLRSLPRAIVAWAILLVVGGWVLQTRPFAALFEQIPLLLFVQFPWRLLTFIGLGSALLAAGLVEGLTERPWLRGALAGSIVVASLLTALLGLDPEQTPVEDRFLSTETVIRSELADWGLGGAHSGEYLPVSSGQRNAARLRKAILDAEGSRTSGPIPLTIERIDWQPSRIAAYLTNAGSATARLVVSQFAFDGWNTTVDGMTVRTEATGQLGLASVRVAPGNHTVELTWNGQSTTVRQFGVGLSCLSFVVLATLVLSYHVRVARRWLWVGASTALLAAGFWWGSTTIAPAPVAVQSTAIPGWRPVDDTLALLDAHTDTSRLVQDKLVLAHLTWLVLRTPTTGYRAFVEVTDDDGSVHRAPWVYEPLSRLWEPGQLTRTIVAVRLPVTMPSGRLDVALVFDQPAGLAPIPLGDISLPASSQSGSAHSPVGRDVDFADNRLRLTLPIESRWTIRAGQSLDLSLAWETRVSVPDREHELLVRAVVTDAAGRTVPATDVRRPGAWFAPLPFWQAGEIIPQNLRVRPPATLAPGEFPLALEVYPRDLARGGASEPGASSANVRGQPQAVFPLGTLVIVP